MPETRFFEAGDVVLQNGMTLRGCRLAYRTHGRLNAEGTNCIVLNTSFGALTAEFDWWVGEGKALDPTRWFIVVPAMLGNGESTSPSNIAPPYDRGRWPGTTHWDNIQLQYRLLTEVLGVRRIALATGWSMGGQQAFHWGALFPDFVDRIAPICGTARCAPHNFVFLEGVKATLTTDAAYRDGWFHEQPLRGLRAMGRVYAGWALSQAFYREELWRQCGAASLEDFLVSGWEGNFLKRDANNLLAMIHTWQRADIADNPMHGGNLDAALGAIRARALVMPGETDLYFTVADNAAEVARMPRAELRPIPSIWGHRAGNPVQNPADWAFLDTALRGLLES